MGCGASKGTEPAARPGVPPPPAAKPEFTPDDKPRPATIPAEIAKAKESAARVDQIVKSGVADFEDDTDTKKDRPVEAEPAQVAPVAVLPPPPVTPPAAAKKPSFKTADPTNDFDDVPVESASSDYFPAQVSLAVGGTGGFFSQEEQQRQSVTNETSLQPFDFTPTTSVLDPVPEPAAPELPAAPVPALLPAASSRQLQPLPLPQQQLLQAQQSQHQRVLQTQQSQEQQLLQTQQSQQQRVLQPQRSARLPPLQTQPQPLTESGPGPMSSSATPAGGASGDDPWSSLQSTYRIRESQAAVKADSTRSRGPSTGNRSAGREVLVLGEDDDDFGGGGAGGLNSTANSAMNRTAGLGGRSPLSLPPPQYGAAPKKGGWGSGAMAQAGELMIGEDDWLVQDRPPGGSGGMQPPPPPAQRQQQQAAAVMAYNSRARLVAEEEDRHSPVALKGPAPVRAKAAEDVMCEDVEDVDMLLEDEMERHGLTNKNLASKLAAYEAQFRDDDD